MALVVHHPASIIFPVLVLLPGDISFGELLSASHRSIRNLHDLGKAGKPYVCGKGPGEYWGRALQNFMIVIPNPTQPNPHIIPLALAYVIINLSTICVINIRTTYCLPGQGS